MPVFPKERSSASKGAHSTKPGIGVDARGFWRYRGQAIENRGVLSYFKQQLRRDAKGYYIENVFGERREHAYLDKVEAFPLQVRTILPLALAGAKKELGIQLGLDSHESISVPAQSLYVLGVDNMAVLLSARGDVPARLSPAAMTSLMPYLHQDQNQNYFLLLPSAQRKQKLSLANPENFLEI